MPYRRIYIDSRFAMPGGNGSSFQYSLPNAVTLPASTVAVIDGIHLPNCVPCIREGINDKLYWREQLSGQSVVEKTATLDPGNYNANTLAVQLAHAMNTATSFSSGVQGGVTVLPYSVTYSTSDGIMQITNVTLYSGATPPIQQNIGSVFRMMTRVELQALSTWNGGALDTANLHDVNEQMGRVSGTSANVGVGTQLRFTEAVNVLPVQSIFLCSPDLGTRSSLGCRGETDILARVPISVAYGQYVEVNNHSGFDHFDVSHQTLGILSFQLRDSAGRELDMQGRHIAFSILFIDARIF